MIQNDLMIPSIFEVNFESLNHSDDEKCHYIWKLFM